MKRTSEWSNNESFNLRYKDSTGVDQANSWREELLRREFCEDLYIEGPWHIQSKRRLLWLEHNKGGEDLAKNEKHMGTSLW